MRRLVFALLLLVPFAAAAHRGTLNLQPAGPPVLGSATTSRGVVAVVRHYFTTTAGGPSNLSRALATTANSAEVELGPGLFDESQPGNTDCGAWLPAAGKIDGLPATEINTGSASVPGNTRAGWYTPIVYEQTLTPTTIKMQLRMRASLGGGYAGRIFLRLTAVYSSGATWVTTGNFLATNIPGETSHTDGQLGWAASNEYLTVTTAAADYVVTFPGTWTTYTFDTVNHRVLVEIGFGDADGDSNDDRVWRLLYNQDDSWIDLPLSG